MAPQQITLEAQPRTILGKQVRHLRRAGLVPANIYGHGSSRAIQAPAKQVEHLLAQAGRSGLISVAVEGGKPETVVLKTIQRDPKSGALTHLDFQAVSLTETVTASVPIRFVGEAPAVKAHGGVLVHSLTELSIESMARDLPEAITVDLSSLEELHSMIRAGDLQLPDGVRLHSPADELVATVQPPAVIAEEEEAAPEAAAEEAEQAAAAEGEEETAAEA